MAYTIEMYKESCDAIREKTGDFKPGILLILGSGLGFIGDQIENPVFVPYAEVPHMKSSTAPGHIGRFVFGEYCGKKVMVMQGRIHAYEGYSPEDIIYPVRLAALLGVKTLIVTNAAGACNPEYKEGDLMLIKDHIRFGLLSPLAGPNLEEFGTRFPDMSDLYTKRLRDEIKKSAAELGIELKEGVYMFFTGPQYETPAEVRAARILGADAVGMSTVMEACAAGHCGMDVIGFTLCTNMAAGVSDRKLGEQEVLDCARECAGKFSAVIRNVIARL